MGRYAEKHKSFYNSTVWRELREQVLADNGYLCVECKRKGKIRHAKQVHHRVTLEQDMSKALEYDNLEPLCSECHNKVHERGSELQRFVEEWNESND